MALKLFGHALLPADRARVWDGLHDAACLKLCIPGCLAVERVSPERFDLTVRITLGPVGIAFDGMVEIDESERPCRLALTARGEGGLAGRAVGCAHIRLADAATGCRLDYVAEVEPRGLIATFGSQLLIGRARALVDGFVATFSAMVETSLAARHHPMRRQFRRRAPRS